MAPTAADEGSEADPGAEQVPNGAGSLAWVLACVGGGMFLVGLDSIMVTTSLPTIATELGAVNSIAWVLAANLLAATVATPLYGKLGDRWGRRPLYVLACSLLAFGSALAAFAWGPDTLIIARAVSGLGIGGFMALGSAQLADVIAPRDRGRYAWLFPTAAISAALVGPVVGGALADSASWRWMFAVTAGTAGGVLVLILARLPSGARAPAAEPVDVAGVLLLGVAITAMVLVTTLPRSAPQLGGAAVAALAAVGVAAAVGLVLVELRVADPVLPVRLFRLRAFTLVVLVGFLTNGAVQAVSSYLPLYTQVVQGLSAAQSGLVMAPAVLVMAGATVLVGRLITRTGRYRGFPIVGCVVAAAGTALLGRLDAQTPVWQVVVSMALVSAGMAGIGQVIGIVVQNTVPQPIIGAATATTSVVRQTGSSLGVALLGASFGAGLAAALSARLPSGASAFERAFADGRRLPAGGLSAVPPEVRADAAQVLSDVLAPLFAWSAPVLLAAAVVAAFVPARPLRAARPVRPVRPDHGAPRAPGLTGT